jgi:hypothetical protein
MIILNDNSEDTSKKAVLNEATKAKHIKITLVCSTFFSDKKVSLPLDTFAIGDDEFLGEVQQFSEARPSFRIKVPADEHEVLVDAFRAEAGVLEAMAGGQEVEDLLAVQIGVGREVRRVAEGEHLVESHAVRPDVAFVAELALATLEGFRGVPFEGEGAGVGRVVVVAVVVGELGEAKVGDLHAVLAGDENVAGCEIPVDDFLQLEVLHALEDQTTSTPLPFPANETHLRDVRREMQQILHLQVRPVDRQIRQQRSVVHVLHDDQQRILSKAVDLHDVLVLERLHDLRLALEVAKERRGFDGAEQLDGHGRLVFEGGSVLHVAAEDAAVVALETIHSQARSRWRFPSNSPVQFHPGKSAACR